MLYDCATNITRETILFEDASNTYLTCPAGLLPCARMLPGDVVKEGGMKE